MEFQILSASSEIDKQHWLASLEKIPTERRDVYFEPGYINAYADSKDVEACCLICRKGEALLLYPFLRSRILRLGNRMNVQQLWDIQAAYGYGGPVVNSAGEDCGFLRQVWDRFSTWCLSENIVSEFVRFHPLLDNVRWSPNSMRTFKDRVTVPIMLESYETALRDTSYYRVHRQMLNKAQRMGFSFQVLPARTEMTWFATLYRETQDFLNAGNETRFGLKYFEALSNGLGSYAWLGVIKKSDEITAAAVVLEGPTYIHSHLMGYRRDIQTAGMTNLLYHGIALEGVRRGKKVLHMGGGRTNSEEDTLFRFKESLSPERADFCLGTLCHNELQYAELGLEWESRHGPRPKGFFQFYRLNSSELM